MLQRAWERRVLVLLLAAALTAAVLLLAPSLSQVRFEAGRRLSPGQGGSPQGSGGPRFNLDLFSRVLFWTFLILLPFSIVAAFIWPESFKSALIRSVVLVLFLLMLLFTIRALKDFLDQLLGTLRSLGDQGIGSTDPAAGEWPTVTPARAPGWAIFPFLLGGLGLLALVGWWVSRLSRRGRGEPTLAGLALVAGNAVKELAAGRDLRNVILRCYREMTDLLSEREQVPFPKTMTPREFEAKLRAAGVRDEHVEQLSQLFELIRYGGRASGEQEEQRAVQCLRAIERAYSLREAAA